MGSGKLTRGSEGIERLVQLLLRGYYPETDPPVPLYARDPLSFTPSFKGIPIRLVRSAATDAAELAVEHPNQLVNENA